MCEGAAAEHDIRATLPRPAAGDAVDPITLAPVDEVTVTTLVDNVYDALLASSDMIARAPIAAGTAQAHQFESGSTLVGLVAEHGYSALVNVRRDGRSTSLLFDTGLSPNAMGRRLQDAGRVGAARRPGGAGRVWRATAPSPVWGSGRPLGQTSSGCGRTPAMAAARRFIRLG